VTDTTRGRTAVDVAALAERSIHLITSLQTSEGAYPASPMFSA
jgi:hypothetical protein